MEKISEQPRVKPTANKGDSDAVTAWMEKLADRNERAAEEIWRRYFEQLLHLARKKLTGKRRAVDEEDVALSAMNSFFEGAQAGRFPDLNDRDDLWRLLVVITTRKAAAKQREQMAQRRGGGNVRGESVFQADQPLGMGEVLGEQPSPELAFEMLEAFEQRLAQLPKDEYRTIALWKLEGYTNEEIAARLGWNKWKVERKLRAIRECWSDGDE